MTSIGRGFDAFAEGYDGGMRHPLKRLLGANLEEFLAVKVDWLLHDLRERPIAHQRDLGALRVLDYGCGSGDFLQVFRRKGFAGELAGCDISTRMLEEAGRRWSTEKPPAFLPLGNPESEIPGAPYDLIVACSVLHHIPIEDREALLARIRRSTLPGGRLVVFEHNPYNPVTQLVVRTTRIDEDAALLGPGSVRRAMVAAGFDGIRRRYLLFFPARFRHPVFRALDRRLGWLPLGGQYAVVGDVAR